MWTNPRRSSRLVFGQGPRNYSLRLTIRDFGHTPRITTTWTFNVSIIDVNDAPVALGPFAMSIFENAATAASVTRLTASDQDGRNDLRLVSRLVPSVCFITSSMILHRFVIVGNNTNTAAGGAPAFRVDVVTGLLFPDSVSAYHNDRPHPSCQDDSTRINHVSVLFYRSWTSNLARGRTCLR